MFWVIIFTAVFLISVLAIIYLSWIIGKYALVEKLANKKRWKKRFISFSLVLAIFICSIIFLSFVDAFVVILHLMIFALIYGGIIRIIEKLQHRKIKINLRGHLNFITGLIYLSIAYFLCVNVWKTTYNLKTAKDINSVKIALITDSHLGNTLNGDDFTKYLDKISEENPDMILISGDFVDDETTKEDMIKACEALNKINPPMGIYFAYGNHDKGYSNKRNFTAEDLEQIMEKNNIHVLEDEIFENSDYVIVGRKDASSPDRKSIEELTKTLNKNKYIIVLDHQPSDFTNEANANVDLVLSGHTHGGQLLPITKFGELTGMSDKTYGYERRENSDFIVSSGISDWAIHFKTGTKSEYVIININLK